MNPGLFAILGQSNFDQIGAALASKYTGEYLQLAHGQWLLAAPGKTTKEISDALGISSESSIGTAVIVAFSNYYGRANPQIWEWLKSRLEVPRG
jgi:hypothetical protein